MRCSARHATLSRVRVSEISRLCTILRTEGVQLRHASLSLLSPLSAGFVRVAAPQLGVLRYTLTLREGGGEAGAAALLLPQFLLSPFPASPTSHAKAAGHAVQSWTSRPPVRFFRGQTHTHWDIMCGRGQQQVHTGPSSPIPPRILLTGTPEGKRSFSVNQPKPSPS